MGDNELDPTVIKRTQETLGKYIKKPPLTEKLLKKPPFRFLHDVFKAVIRETGYFDGLYTPDELNFENIKDREDKMRFLQKMIDVVKLTTQRDLNVRTSKIVAGHEPERTNELLQMMAEIIEQKLNWKDALEVLSNGAGRSNDLNKVKEKDEEKEKVQEKEEEKEKGSTAKKKESSKGDNSKDIPKSKAGTKESKPKSNPNLKEGKNNKNATPSPDEKVRKTIKAASKPKEKTLSRQATIEKVGKEPKVKEKDKEKEKEKVVKKSKDVAEKTKVSKTTKDDVKRVSPAAVQQQEQQQSPSPNQNVTNADQSINNKMRQKSLETEIINGDMKDIKEASNELLPRRDSKENVYIDVQKDGQRRDSKQMDEGESIAPMKSNENSINGEIHAIELTGSRKSSAKHERKTNSSVKNRPSSIKKSRSPAENDISDNGTQQQTITPESSKSLKTVNENDILAKDAKVELLNEKELKNQQQLLKTAKRESTFTHENSRDSVGSNSNSSTTRPRTSLRPPSARPPSARPGAPRRRDKNIEIILQPNDEIKMSNINVKLESFGGDLDDDGENLVIIEDATSAVNFVEESNSNLETVQLEQQGHLVQQILETQKELTKQNNEVGLKGDKDNSESAYDANMRQSSARQMNNLRDIIQTLTKSISPFGKLMDFIPEDIDAMQLEFNMWRDTYSQAANDLKRERSLTESATEPMKNQLMVIEANIQEYLEMIDASRVKILQNHDKIVKMLLEQ